MGCLRQEGQFRKVTTISAKGLEIYEPGDVTILQNKGIDDAEESNLMLLGLKLKYHLFGDMHSVAHTHQKIWAFRVNRPHGGDIFARGCLQLFNTERDNRT